jgi:hypothetical protein
MVPVPAVVNGDRRGNGEDCLDAPWAQRAAATGQRRGVDQMTAQRTIGAPSCGETECCGVVADEVVQCVDCASERQIAAGRLARLHHATSVGVLGGGSPTVSLRWPTPRASSELVGTISPGVDPRK